MFKLKEVVTWLGMTVLEIFILVISVLIYSVLLTLKVEGYFALEGSWWIIHSPLFVSDALIAYFSVIVFVRQYLDGSYRLAIFRALWSFNQVLLLFLAKLLLCFKLENKKITHSEVFSPIFFLSLLLVIRSCQLH